MRWIAIGMAGLLALLGVGACAKPTIITKAEYAAAADRACATATAQAGDLTTAWVRDNPKATGVDGTERFVRFSLIKHYRATMQGLRTVPAPPGDASYLDSMYGDFEHALTILYSDPLGRSALDAERSAVRRFRSYGLKQCASMATAADNDIDGKLSRARAEQAKAGAKSAKKPGASD